jgi:hypothetical protein
MTFDLAVEKDDGGGGAFLDLDLAVGEGAPGQERKGYRYNRLETGKSSGYIRLEGLVTWTKSPSILVRCFRPLLPSSLSSRTRNFGPCW